LRRASAYLFRLQTLVGQTRSLAARVAGYGYQTLLPLT
jgi:hypothetical protein